MKDFYSGKIADDVHVLRMLESNQKIFLSSSTRTLPLIASLSPLQVAWVEVVFVGYCGFLNHLQLASHELTLIWQDKLMTIKFPTS